MAKLPWYEKCFLFGWLGGLSIGFIQCALGNVSWERMFFGTGVSMAVFGLCFLFLRRVLK